MSAAQWLIAIVGLVTSTVVYRLMRDPQARREQYRGTPFSIAASLLAAGLVLAFVLALAWAQGAYEHG